MIIPIEATLPRQEVKPISEEKKRLSDDKKTERINREELYEKMKDLAECSKVYMMMVALSTIVSSIGFQHNSSTIIIGAMVIAPLFGPNMALALGTCLGDLTLIKKSLFTNLIGIFIAIILSFGIGLSISFDSSATEVQSRLNSNFGDFILALASGIAGSLAITTELSSALIGVMVAVALLPALVNFGLLAGSGQYELALGALSLFLMNLICINAAGVVTFLAEGISPGTWWDKKRALKTSRIILGIWFSLFFIGSCLLFLYRKGMI